MIEDHKDLKLTASATASSPVSYVVALHIAYAPHNHFQ